MNTHSQWRLSGGQVQTPPPPTCWGSLAGCAQTAQGIGSALTDRQLRARDSVNLALHPCQKAADFLPYSRPPDFFTDNLLVSRRSSCLEHIQEDHILEGTIQEGPISERTIFGRDSSSDCKRLRRVSSSGPPLPLGDFSFSRTHVFRVFAVSTFDVYAHSLISAHALREGASRFPILMVP